MENPTQTGHILDPHRPQPLPTTLNVLTILTFIGCGLSYLFGIWGFVDKTDPDEQVEKIREAQERLGDSFMGRMMEGSIEVLQKTHENRMLIFITGIIFTTLCLWGAIRMRKLSKGGYYLYVVGEMAPVVLMAGLFGSSFLSVFNLLFATLIAIIFVILYSTQLKYLTNK